MIFECKMTTDRNANGQLEAYAVTWIEARTTAEAAGHGFAYILMIAGLWVLIMSVPAVVQGYSPALFLLAIPCFAAVYPVMWRAWRISGTRRAIVFTPSGVIESPFGLARDGNRPVRWRNTWQEIVNFESEQLKPNHKDGYVGYTHGVRAINREGDVLHIAEDLEPDHAHKLAHMLTLAIQAVRDETAERSPVRQRAKQTID